MRKTKKAVALLLGMSMIATCFTACGGGSDKKEDTSTGRVEKFDEDKVNQGTEKTGIQKPEAKDNNADAEQLSLKVWCPTEEQEITKELCKIFDDSHPEYAITFDYGVVPESECKTQVELDPQNAADVFMFAGDHLRSLQEGGYLAKLGDAIQAEVKDTHVEQAVNSASIDGTVYAVPFTANLWYMFYNKSMYSADEVQSLDTMLAKDFPDVNGNHVYNFAIGIGDSWYLAGFFYAGGCTLFGPDGTDATQCDWAEDKGIAVIDYLNSVVATGKLHNDNSTDSINMLKDGTVAAFCTGSWNASAIKEALKDNYAAACAPKIKVGDTEEWLKPFADFKMIGVNAATENQKAAQELAVFLAGDYAQLSRLQLREIQPTVKKLIEDESITSELDYPTNYPAVQASLDQMAHTVNRPSTTQLGNYWSIGETIGKLIYKQDEKITGEGRKSLMKDTLVPKIVAQAN